MRLLLKLFVALSLIFFSTLNINAFASLSNYITENVSKFDSVKDQLKEYDELLNIKKNKDISNETKKEIISDFFAKKAKYIFKEILSSDYKSFKDTKDENKFLSETRKKQIIKIISDMESKISNKALDEVEMGKLMQQLMHWRDVFPPLEHAGDIGFTGLYKDPSNLLNFSEKDLSQLESNKDRINAYVITVSPYLRVSTLINSIFSNINIYPIFTNKDSIAHYGLVTGFGDFLSHDFFHFKNIEDKQEKMLKNGLWKLFSDMYKKTRNLDAEKKEFVDHAIFLLIHEVIPASRFLDNFDNLVKSNQNSNDIDMIYSFLSDAINETYADKRDPIKKFNDTFIFNAMDKIETSNKKNKSIINLINDYTIFIPYIKETSTNKDEVEIQATVNLVKRKNGLSFSSLIKIDEDGTSFGDALEEQKNSLTMISDAQIVLAMLVNKKGIGMFATPFIPYKNEVSSITNSIKYTGLDKYEEKDIRDLLALFGSKGSTFYDLLSENSKYYETVAEPIIYVLDKVYKKGKWRDNECFPSWEKIIDQIKVLLNKTKEIYKLASKSNEEITIEE